MKTQTEYPMDSYIGSSESSPRNIDDIYSTEDEFRLGRSIL